MYTTGYSAADQKDFITLMTSNHAIDITVQLLKLDHTYVGDVSTKLLTGQVTMDTNAETSRMLNMDLLDPLHQLKLDGNSPDDGSIFFNRMLKVSYGILSPDRTRRYYIPVFCGPIASTTRDDAVVSVTCKGKESMMSSALWTSKTYAKGLKKTDVIKNIVRYIGGEAKYDIPDRPDRLTKAYTITKDTTAYLAARSLASGMGYQFFYDGRGVLKMRLPPASSLYTFSDKGAILTTPQPSYNVDNAINAVEVVGGVPNGAKTNVYWRVSAPASHPLSPWALGRNGVPRYLTLTVSDDNLKTVAACKARAQTELSNALIESMEVAFDSMVIPFLEEGDFCTVKNDSWSNPFRLSKMTIPLVASNSASIGYLKNMYKRGISGGNGGGGTIVRAPAKTKKRKGKKK